MRYWMMRLFLTRRERPGLLEIMQPRSPEPRDIYLRRLFGVDIRFAYRSRMYIYSSFRGADGYLCGVIAREHTVTVSAPPEERYQLKEVPDWETANVFIDPTGHDDGQKVAMQEVAAIGKPLAVFRALADQLNERNPDADWIISVNAVTEEQEFWSAVSRNKGRISELDLVFVAPNIWGGVTETENALRVLNRENNAQQVEVRLVNPDKKLSPDSKNIREAVEYVTKGGGAIRLKEGKKQLFNSEDKVVTQSPEEDAPIQAVQEDDIELLLRLARRIFGQ